MKTPSFFKRSLLTLLALSFVFQLFAAPPPTYYSGANNKSSASDALRIALFDIIKGHTIIGYSSLLNSVYAASSNPSDFVNGTDKTLEDIYSSVAYKSTQGGSSATLCGQAWNKEHTVPQSWFNEASPMVSDAFHIYPTDIRMNSARSNLAYGNLPSKPINCTVGYGKGGSAAFTSDGTGTTIFDPGDAGYKGDIARTYFYMITRYRDKDLARTTQAQEMFSYASGIGNLTSYSITLLMEWHKNDPVSQKERNRNDAIYAHQNNRNPFIDYPCLAEYIWGDSITKSVDFSKLASSYDAEFTGQGCPCEMTTDPKLTSPTTTPLSFSALPNATATQTITVKGINLTKNITLTLSGTNASLFSLSASSATSAEGLAGKSITITYSPTAETSHTASLTISSTEFTNVVVTLNGTCSNSVVVPTVTSPTYSEGSAGGTITSFGGAATLTENGIYYGTSTGFSEGTKLTATTKTTTGTFWVDVSALAIGTYYYKAFATNSTGTGYSTEGTFTIPAASQAPAAPMILMGKPVTTTLTVTGTTNLLVNISNLANSVTVTSSATEVVTVSPASITPAEAAAGKTITVARVKNGTATITIAGGVVNQVISVTCE